jgi:hypothetical protein
LKEIGCRIAPDTARRRTCFENAEVNRELTTDQVELSLSGRR